MSKNNTKRSLLASVFALVLCVAMLVGSTFAWFTDTASTGVNKIQAGNLDIKVEYAKEKMNADGTLTGELTDWAPIDNSTNVFDPNALWEPGRTEYVVFRITNNGNLALKYKLSLETLAQKPGTNKANEPFYLADYLCASAKVNPNEIRSGVSTSIRPVGFMTKLNDLGSAGVRNVFDPEYHPLTDATVNGTLLPGKANCVPMAIWMPTSVGNEANAISTDKAATIDFGINVVATQDTVEKDSFGNTYDKDADYTIQVNKDNIQDYLDGKYGSINGMTLVLAAGNYDKIEFGRATAYEGSNTKYYLGGTESSPDAIKQNIAGHPNGGAGKREYVRSMSNVTLKAADGATVTINGLVAFGGQVSSTKWYSRDFVADRDMSATENNNICYWIGQRWSNITFEGLTFTGGVNIEAYGNKDTLIDNVKFDNCKFSITDNPSETYCIRLNVDGNIAKANNLVVEKCEFTNGLTAVLTDGMPNVTVTDSIFSGLTRHAINPMMNYLPKAPGYGKITVTGNTFKNMSTKADKGTILRMGEVGAGAVFTIKNNTATEGITLANSIKVNSLADGITYDISGNSWASGLTASDSRLNG